MREPSFGPIEDQVGQEKAAFSFSPEVSNPTSYSLSFSLSGTLLSGLVFSGLTGSISGVPLADGYGDFTIMADYDLGFVMSEEFRITIEPALLFEEEFETVDGW